ncbi:MAG: hypothetical protein M1823_001581 [Watsoniomyces obsoletus]|nr:MAG: hypothetical protein M1823_001581 [Watsoniomyces obsoletus]
MSGVKTPSGKKKRGVTSSSLPTDPKAKKQKTLSNDGQRTMPPKRRIGEQGGHEEPEERPDKENGSGQSLMASSMTINLAGNQPPVTPSFSLAPSPTPAPILQEARLALGALRTNCPSFPSNNARPYLCRFEGCGKGFKRKGCLTRHEKLHDEARVRPHVCQVEGCGWAFDNKYQLADHSRTHLGAARVRPYVCPIDGCGWASLSKKHLTQHMKTHEEGRVRADVCLVEGCGSAFYTATNLSAHALVHEENKFYVCSFEGCNRTLKDTTGLEIHELAHLEVEPSPWSYVCSFQDRGEGFPTSTTLAIHQKAHVVDMLRSLVCPWKSCGNVFEGKEAFQQHLRSHEQFYRLSQCVRKTVKKKKSRRVFIQTHTKLMEVLSTHSIQATQFSNTILPHLNSPRVPSRLLCLDLEFGLKSHSEWIVCQVAIVDAAGAFLLNVVIDHETSFESLMEKFQ